MRVGDDDIAIFEQMRHQLIIWLRVEVVRAGVEFGAQNPYQLVDLLRHRATVQPGDRAYVFLSERGAEDVSLTFAELDRRARAVAASLARHAQKRDRAVLMFPPGIEFIVGFFGCLLADVIPSSARTRSRRRFRVSTGRL